MEEERKVREVLESRLKEKGYTLEGVRYYLSKEGPKLELVVDRDDPISLDDIVALSDFISPILDENDPIAGAYTLDISSLGAEKPIALEKLDARNQGDRSRDSLDTSDHGPVPFISFF